MANLFKYCLLVSILLFAHIKLSTQIQCYVCNERLNPLQCGVNLQTTPLPIETIECAEACVTFKNKYDGGSIVRNCTSGVWIPPTGKYNDTLHSVENCIRDKFSQELFCFCQTDLCNRNNTGDSIIFAINECSSNPCQNGGTCEDLYNKFKCNCVGNFDGHTCSICKPGYTGVKCDQKLSEPCFSNPCLNAGTCTQDLTYYNYTCTCAAGFYGANCQSEIDECLSKPCRNGGVCSNLKGSYSCACTSGFTGTSCETNIDECTAGTNFCNTTNSQCVDTVGSYNCTCNPGYTGRYCDTNINECASNPCLHGTCADKDNEFVCTCFKGYEGTFCNTTMDFCVSTPCQNGGVCRNDTTNLKYICDCKPGFTGLNCETQLKACSLFPCKYGDCAEGTTYPDYTCTCLPGYTGKNCTEDIDECLSNPCKYGACTNLLNTYKCTCLPGYTGKNCDINIDECASYPCQYGTCVDGVNSFKCTCEAGYTGTLCDQDINECQSNPCLNLGTCVNLVNSYACLCNTDFYTGKRCEKPVLRCFEPEGVDPCNSNGDCEGGIGYSPIVCKCFPDYTGQFCETRVSKCTNVVCLNGGSCVEDEQNLNGYYCACPSDYTGQFCETKISACADLRINCNNGVCVDINTSFKCTCDAGYTGLFCTDQYFTCLSVGTFADPLYCQNYIYCDYNEFGVLEAVTETCPKLSTYQLLFDASKLNCVLPGKHPNPGCYVPPVA